MGTDLEKKLIEDLKQLKILELNSSDYFLGKEEYKDLDEWNNLKSLFTQLDNIEGFMSIDFGWNSDIYSELRKLKNLTNIYFYSSEISDTEEFLDDGLRKFPKLEALWLAGTQLKKLPNVIIKRDYLFSSRAYKFPNLTKLALIGNEFYKQNFHFKLNKNCENIYKKIQELGRKKRTEINKKAFEKVDKINESNNLDRKKQREIKNELIDNTYLFHEYAWGLSNWDSTICILKDDFINDNTRINSLSVYVLNENTKSKYEIFKAYNDFFIEINKELNCFKKINKNDLDIFFYSGTDIYDEKEIGKLKQLQKDGVTKQDKYFVSDLLISLGGEELIVDIAKEQTEDDSEISKDFYKQNNWIESITIENFKLFDKKQEISNLEGVNVVVGKNGAGKTSLLQAITASLIPHKSNEIEDLLNYINIELKDNTNISRFARTVAKWSHFKKAQRLFSNEIQLEAIDNKENDLPQSYLILAYGENLYAEKLSFEKEKQDYQDILVSGFYKSYHTKSIFKTSYNKMPNPLELLNSLSEENIKEKYKLQKQELLNIATIICDKLNIFLKESTAKKFKIKKEGVYYKFYDTVKEQYLDYEQISEGYRSYIILITDIVMRILAARKRLLVNGYKTNEIFNKVKGAIIIDEFDKHMHPTWQRTFLKTLKKEFPKIQFFLSTHNIVSLQSAEGEKVFIISIDDKGKINIEDETLLIGNTIDEIYQIYFGNKIYSEKSNALIEEFNQLKRLAKLENNIEYLNAYIKKSEAIKKEFKANQSQNFSNALNIDIAQLTDFFKKQDNDKNK